MVRTNIVFFPLSSLYFAHSWNSPTINLDIFRNMLAFTVLFDVSGWKKKKLELGNAALGLGYASWMLKVKSIA